MTTSTPQPPPARHALDALLPDRRDCCSDYDLDRLAAGDLAAAAADKLRAHLASSPSCAARLREMEAATAAAFTPKPLATSAPSSPATISSTPPVTPPPPRRLPTTATPTSSRWRAPTAAAAMAVAASALFVFAGRNGPADDGDGRKGANDAVFEVHRQVGAGSALVPSGATVQAGDELRFVVVGGAGAIATIVDVDGAGSVSILAGPVPLASSRNELPNAVRLDATAGVEHLTLFLCDHAVDADVLARAASTHAAAPAGCASIARELAKAAP